MEAAYKFVQERATSARKMSTLQVAHICQILAQNLDKPVKDLFDLMDKDIIQGLQRSAIDGKLQNEKNLLRKFIGLGKNGQENPAATLKEVQQAWEKFSAGTTQNSASSSSPQSNSKEYNDFLGRIKQAGGAEKATKFDNAKKHGGFAKTKDSEAVATELSVATTQSLLATQDPHMSQSSGSQASLTWAAPSQTIDVPEVQTPNCI